MSVRYRARVALKKNASQLEFSFVENDGIFSIKCEPLEGTVNLTEAPSIDATAPPQSCETNGVFGAIRLLVNRAKAVLIQIKEDLHG